MPNSKQDLLIWIFNRMCFHYSMHHVDYSTLKSQFITQLEAYPEDLLCAAYTHISRMREPHTFPKPDDFIHFMAPAYHQRQLKEAAHG